MKAKLDYFVGRQVSDIVVGDDGTWEIHLGDDAVIRNNDSEIVAPDANQIGTTLLAADEWNIALGSASEAGSSVSYHAVLTDYTISGSGFDDPDAEEVSAEDALPPDPSPDRAVEAPEGYEEATTGD